MRGERWGWGMEKMGGGCESAVTNGQLGVRGIDVSEWEVLGAKMHERDEESRGQGGVEGAGGGGFVGGGGWIGLLVLRARNQGCERGLAHRRRWDRFWFQIEAQKYLGRYLARGRTRGAAPVGARRAEIYTRSWNVLGRTTLAQAVPYGAAQHAMRMRFRARFDEMAAYRQPGMSTTRNAPLVPACGAAK